MVDLIERLAALIADAVIADHPAVQGVTVTVHKPKAPITVPFADVSVTIERWRSGRNTDGKTGRADEGRVTPMHHAVIALGGNKGDVAASMRSAIADIDGLEGTQVTGISPLYRTAAWGMPDGTPDFLNAVIEVTTELDAASLLGRLQHIEVAHGRTREQHWASRTLDLDIIDVRWPRQRGPECDFAASACVAGGRSFWPPWLALDPAARLAGPHGGEIADLLHEAGDREDVHRIDDSWMTGMADDAPVQPSGSAADIPQFDGTVDGSARKPGDGDTATVQPAIHTAVISMDSRSNEAETLFRTAIVALEGIPGDQVEGISPLYHVSHLHGSDAMSAVMQMTCRMDAKALIATLGSVEESLNGDVDLDLVDMPGTVCDEPDCRVPWPSARTHASVLAPWMDMDPQARLGGDPVSYLLAMAPDADRVGLLSDTWIVGSTE